MQQHKRPSAGGGRRNGPTSGRVQQHQQPQQQPPPAANTKNKFMDARSKHIESARKLATQYESSSEEEDESQHKNVFDSVFRNYSGESGDLQKTQQFLENIFQSGAATCLICIASIKRTAPIWSCEYCSTFFHLPCIQRWANDSTSLKRLNQDHQEGGYYTNQGVYVAKEMKPIQWNCPNCRHNYQIDEIPREYLCFCKNELNPSDQPWLVPHSCGEMCKKLLQPECGHRCLLLCHPGPCPPCPQMIQTSCCCGQSNLKTIRCSQNSWKCLNKCKQKLKCGIHTCGSICHNKSDCPPCTKRSKQSCLCGAQIQERNCTNSHWQCTKICNKSFSCGIHKCELRCHEGDCGDCPYGQPRECPCGKQKTQAPCSEEIGPCGDTCLRVLACGEHVCMERCHKGDCSQCLEITRKQCRCGSHGKELPCSKTYICEVKCKQMRDCNKHACNRKCCDGQCPPCDKICGKTLSCGKHKCTSLCHHGLCYPCPERASVKCRCGGTVFHVPCGREKKTRPPNCHRPCRIVSKCHHTNPHRCHQNDCPACVQVCLLPNDTTGCQHLCQKTCHDSVAVCIKDANFKPVGPWDVQPEIIEIRKLPHPKCEESVLVQCIGGHETVPFPCWNSKPRSCGRRCGRQLKCGNHTCEVECHRVKDINGKMEDESCMSCEEGCIFPRPDGCVHLCSKPCHSDPCKVCDVPIKIPCYCGLTQIHLKCGDYYKRNPTEADQKHCATMKSCGNQCIKNYPCGHRCIDFCHTGPCPSIDMCKKKVKISCECKTRKLTIGCDKIRSGFALNCDVACDERKQKLQQEIEEREMRQREMEEEKNRQELLDFEKKFGKKKYKERKRNVVEEKQSNLLQITIGVAAISILVAILAYFLIFN